MIPFWIIKYTIFYWYLTLFFSEAVEASRCFFFENWLMKLKCPNLLRPLSRHHISKKIINPSEPFSYIHFTMIHPVPWLFKRVSCLLERFIKQSLFFLLGRVGRNLSQPYLFVHKNRAERTSSLPPIVTTHQWTVLKRLVFVFSLLSIVLYKVIGDYFLGQSLKKYFKK